MNTKKIVKFWKEWKWATLLLIICIAGIPLTTIYGIQSVTWGNDFWPNALSEFLGMFVELIFGAVFTFVVIDKYMLYHKNKQWSKIKQITYKNLYFILSNFLLKLNLALPKDKRVEPYILTEDIETLNDYLPKEDFDIFVNSLYQNIDKIIEERISRQTIKIDETTAFADEQIHASLVKFKQHCKPDINTLSTSTIPKLLNFSDDPVVLDGIIELEELFTSLISKINNPHRKNTPPGEHDIKYIWLLKIKDILNKIQTVADIIEEDIEIE